MGEIILKRGERPPNMFIILQGAVKLVITKTFQKNAFPTNFAHFLKPQLRPFSFKHSQKQKSRLNSPFGKVGKKHDLLR